MEEQDFAIRAGKAEIEAVKDELLNSDETFARAIRTAERLEKETA